MQWTSAPNIGEAPLPQRARSYWKTRFSAFHEGLETLLEAERAQLPPWVVVGFGSGVAAWFALGAQRQWAAFLCMSAALALIGFVLGSGRAGRALGWFALAAALGCALVWARSSWVAQPRLSSSASRGHRRPCRICRSPRGQASTVRLTVAPGDAGLPPQIRISIDRRQVPPGIAPGAEIRVKARLAPPPPMALPGTYDFARDAWFQGHRRRGQVAGGRSRSCSRRSRTGSSGRATAFASTSARGCPASSAGIAIALVTGDQNAVDQDDADAMRRSGLTHLLSVSGLHIAAVVAFAMLLSLKLLALERTSRAALEPCAGFGRRRRRGGHRLHLAHRRAGADGAELRRCAADPRRESRSDETPSASA